MADLNKTVFGIVIGLTRSQWTYACAPTPNGIKINAQRNGQTLALQVYGTKATGFLDGRKVGQKALKKIIDSELQPPQKEGEHA